MIYPRGPECQRQVKVLVGNSLTKKCHVILVVTGILPFLPLGNTQKISSVLRYIRFFLLAGGIDAIYTSRNFNMNTQNHQT